MLTLHTYFRSSASFRVRIGLNLKGLSYGSVPVHLLRDGGQQHLDGFRALNPAGLVPVLQDGGEVITQSLAILEYLDERHPEPPFLPGTAQQRAFVRSLALDIACDLHPLNNTRVLEHLGAALGAGKDAKLAWIRHWIGLGFDAFERRIGTTAGRCCSGDQPTLADILLVPQMFNAERFGVDLAPYPTLRRVKEHCMTLEAFAQAAPALQPDAE